MSAKVPAVINLSKQALMENKCVVIGLQSTGEARTEEAVSKYVSPHPPLPPIMLKFLGFPNPCHLCCQLVILSGKIIKIASISKCLLNKHFTLNFGYIFSMNLYSTNFPYNFILHGNRVLNLMISSRDLVSCC